MAPPARALSAAESAEPSTATAPAVLLLHGQPGSAADWDGVVRCLGERATPVAIDRPGWDGVRPASDLEGNARAALAALDARGMDRALVVGHSLGGAIAAWLAAVHPERVTALVLAAPAANLAALYPVDRWLAAPVAGEIAGSVTMAGVGLALAVPWLRRRVSAGTGIDESYLVGVRQAALKPGAWRAYAREQRTLVHDLPELELRLGAITAPTTIVAGAGDRIVPARAARELSGQIPGAQLLVSGHAGHLLPQRDPQLLADAILAALSASQPSTVRGG
ncbi:MAG TPA: alpha/beta fold hydrolase [Solirubrobacteraceae bacterium]|nr:alpha/beta fold hydrolase [Solirubrobacteraceae bacterium]